MILAPLTEYVAAYNDLVGREVYITSGQPVVPKCDSDPMLACDHEEADIRMCLHVSDDVQKGAKTIMVGHICCPMVSVFFEVTTQQPDIYIFG